jgi:hypothetical protein
MIGFVGIVAKLLAREVFDTMAERGRELFSRKEEPPPV